MPSAPSRHAERSEASAFRTNQRNGLPQRTWGTHWARLGMFIPRLREDSRLLSVRDSCISPS